MHRARAAAVLVALLSLALLGPALAGTPDPLGEARRLLSEEKPRAAVAVLEQALVDESAPRGETLGLLRQAYGAAAREADAAGKAHDAELFRDNLEILNRKLKAAPAEVPQAPEP